MGRKDHNVLGEIKCSRMQAVSTKCSRKVKTEIENGIYTSKTS